MAESSIDHASRFRKKHYLEKVKHRDKISRSRCDEDYYNEDDNRFIDFSRDNKPDQYDRLHRPNYDRKHPRSPKHERVYPKSEEMFKRTSPHSSRHEEHRNHRSRSLSSRVDRGTDRSFGSENQENFSSSHRLEKTLERDLSNNNDELLSNLYQNISHLNAQVEFLTLENEKLRHSLNASNHHLSDQTADVNITFKDKYLEEKFLPSLEELVFQLMIGNVSIEDVQQLYSNQTTTTVCQSPEDGRESPCLPEGDLFAVDNTTVDPSDEFTLPKYDSSFSEVLQNEEAATNSKVKEPKSRISCFNCGGNHIIRDCPKRQHYRRPAPVNPSSFRAQVPKGRYHCNGNLDSAFKPGIISEELKKALGLGSNEIPFYIYQMRILDYPPGWLQEATVESSGISLYGIDGNSEQNSGEMERKDDAQVMYDPTKFVDYPGFNIPLAPNIRDVCHELGMPTMQPHHMRSFVEQNVSTKVFCPKRKRKLAEFDVKPAKIQRVEEDMEIECDSDADSIEFIPPLPEDDPPPPPEEDDLPPLPPDMVILSDAEDSNSGANTPLSDTLRETLAQRLKQGDENVCSAPSLRDLEEIKKQLVQELGMASGSSSPVILPEDSTDAVLPDENEASRISDSSSASGSKTLKRTDSQGSKSKLVVLGTPSLSRHSSYQKLPEYENFSKNVTSHLNFENLPNSTGTYQRMKRVLKKVKSKIGSMI